jgi:hypothetical protein
MNFPLRELCKGDSEEIAKLMRASSSGFMWFCIILAIVSSAAYGMSIGIWMPPLQSLYVAIKLPLSILFEQV